jgi:hypothetical protein
MTPVLEAAGFFFAITALLQFSSWAEVWLASTAVSSTGVRPMQRHRSFRDFPKEDMEHASVRIAEHNVRSWGASG